MNLRDLVPASEIAKNLGVKSIVYGGPGAGKTPIVATAPNPVFCVVEPGMLSMRSQGNLPCFEAYDADKIDEFFKWVIESKEAKQFDTIAIDSVSQMAEIYLVQEQKRNKDGRAAYGEMSRRCMEWFNALYFMEQKHVVLIAKQEVFELSGASRRRPFFPGKDLNVKVPHLFDAILHLDKYQIKGVRGLQKALRTSETFDTLARDRSGKLNEFEQPNLASVFAKCMS